jgi:hypothetical protein
MDLEFGLQLGDPTASGNQFGQVGRGDARQLPVSMSS